MSEIERPVPDGGAVYRKTCKLVLLGSLLVFSGCNLLESMTSDVSGWDVSACVTGFGTCWELFFDNADKFEGGFVEAMNSMGQ